MEALYIRLTSEEKELLKQKAATANMNVTDYLRQFIRNGEAKIDPAQEENYKLLISTLNELHNDFSKLIWVIREQEKGAEESIEHIQKQYEILSDYIIDEYFSGGEQSDRHKKRRQCPWQS